MKDSSLETDLDSLASERSSDDTGIGLLGRGSSSVVAGDQRTDVTLSWESVNVYAADNGGSSDDVSADRRRTCSKHIVKDGK